MPRKAKERKPTSQRHFEGDWSQDGQTFYLDGHAYQLKLGKRLPNGNQEVKVVQVKESKNKKEATND